MCILRVEFDSFFVVRLGAMEKINGDTRENGVGSNKICAKPPAILPRRWSETLDDIEIPGTPKTPRSCKTPGESFSSVFGKLCMCMTYYSLTAIWNCLFDF